MILHLGTTAAILVYYREVIAQGVRGLLGRDDVAAGFRRREVVRVGLLAAVATSPLIPLALFFKKMIEKTFEGITVAGFGFLITAAVLLLTAWLEASRWGQGAGRDDLARRPLDRPGPDVRPVAGRQPERADDRGGAGLGLSRTWAVGFSLLIAVPAILGRPSGRSGTSTRPACLPTASARRSRHDPGGRGRLFRDHLADQDRPIGPDLVFFGLPGRAWRSWCSSTGRHLVRAHLQLPAASP